MKHSFLLVLVLCVPSFLFSQQETSQLFKDEVPIDLKFTIGVKDIKGIKNDTVYTKSVLYYKAQQATVWDSIEVEMRARGDFRRKECYYPPLRIKIKKKDANGTVFEGNKSLKLVMPCRQVKDNDLILKEFLCYKIYEPVSKYVFKTRLVNVDFSDNNNRKVSGAQFLGFLIEDDDVVAKRHGGKVVENLKLHPKALDDSSALRHDLFQYMIANTDWSTTFLHNAKLIQLDATKKFIPLTYDFDMAGFVDAPYAVVDPSLGVESVRDRVYRGFCRSDAATQAIRAEFIQHEGDILAAIKKYEQSFSPKSFSGILKYTEEFFATIKSDSKFKASITDKCRTK